MQPDGLAIPLLPIAVVDVATMQHKENAKREAGNAYRMAPKTLHSGKPLQKMTDGGPVMRSAWVARTCVRTVGTTRTRMADDARTRTQRGHLSTGSNNARPVKSEELRDCLAHWEVPRSMKLSVCFPLMRPRV